MQRLTSLPLIAMALHAFAGCTRAVAGNETGDMLDTGGAESTPPRGGATTTGSGDPETGGAGERPSSAAECVDTPPLVGACVVDSEGPFDRARVEQLTPDAGLNSEVRSIEFAFDATVTDRGTAPPTTDCWSYDNFATTRRGFEDGDVTFVDLEDQGGKEWRFELLLPEYDASRFSIGDAVNVDVLVWVDEDEFNYRAGARYRIGRGEELLALVVESEESDVAVTPGTETCYVGEEDVFECGQSQYDMLASHDGEQVEIADGETSEVGGLLVTNDEYVRYYDFGNCNFAGPAFTLGAQPAD